LACLGRLQEGTPVPESFAAIAGFDFGAQSSSGFRLGDRSRLIPPFAGNGMSMAFESAARAAPCLVEYAEGKTSWKEAQNRFRQFEEQAFATRMRMASCLHPILLSRFGLRLIGSLAAMGLLPTQRLFHSLR
jgi:flavin-dependent dehydrogenase